MSVTVKVFGLAEYSSPTKLEAALKRFFLKEFKVPERDTNVLFVTCDSQKTGSPVLVEIGLTKEAAPNTDQIEGLVKVFHSTTNRQINLAFINYAGFLSVENPERNCKYHVGDLAFAKWRKPVEA